MRNKIIRWILFIGALLAVLAYGFIQIPDQVHERPNILFCILDDASSHMSAYGYDWVNTPNFDWLANEGILFLNAYTPNAKCAPSRANVLTGRNSWQLEEAGNHVANFPAKFKTFPEVLRENGYETARTGKGYAPGNPGTVNGKRRELIGSVVKKHNIEPWATGMSSADYASEFEYFLKNKEEDKPWFFGMVPMNPIENMNMVPVRLGVKSWRILIMFRRFGRIRIQSTPFSPSSGPATGSFNGLHPKSNFLAAIPILEWKELIGQKH